MEKRKGQGAFWRVAIGILFALQAALFFIIPFRGSSVFLSPDETANAVVSRQFAQTWSMRLVEPLLATYPWVHPRSFVSQRDANVPVSFIGLTVLTGTIRRIFGEWGMVFFVPLLAVSAAYPIWKFLTNLGKPSQVIAVSLWLSFPSVILYANRGLFPNLPALCLTLWSAYLLWEDRSQWRLLAAGVFAGFALSIRPIESVWILPWLFVAWYSHRGTRSVREFLRPLIPFFISALAILALCFVVAWLVYGAPFAVGYFLRDAAAPAIPLTRGPISWRVLWPFGFHPRSIWFNVRAYTLDFLAPWLMFTFAGAVAAWQERSKRIVVLLGLWTFGVLCLIYGQVVYQDHVGANVTSSGNSFIRYLLPVVPFFCAGVASCVSWFLTRDSRLRMKFLVSGVTMLFISLGTWTALARDAEGVLPSSRELDRYLEIRAEALRRFSPDAVVISERSDKIFFPHFRVATPLPEKSRIREFLRDGGEMVYFGSRVSEKEREKWTSQGLDLEPLFANADQVSYRVMLRP